MIITLYTEIQANAFSHLHILYITYCIVYILCHELVNNNRPQSAGLYIIYCINTCTMCVCVCVTVDQ